ncbi:hypothetical protein IV102_24565 [bacterium]|nr:hypothetical protein [bacterium]
MKKYCRLALILFPLLLSTPPSWAAEPPIRQGACFSLVIGDGAAARKLTANSKVTEKTQLHLFVKALKQPCLAVVTGFKGRGHGSSPDFKATVLELQAGEVKDQIFQVSSPSTQLYVTIVARDSPEAKSLQNMINRWGEDAQREALHNRLNDLFGANGFGMSRQGPVPAELGGVSSTSAQANNPTLQEASGGGNKDSKNEKRQGPAARPIASISSYNWLSEADWAACDQARPGVFIYRVTMSAK